MARQHIDVFFHAARIAAVIAALMSIAAMPANATATTERIVVDPQTGVAIGGYDPVAYFTDGRARRGEDRYALEWAGAIWLFANEGNRAVFRAAPEVYAPRYGGYGALTVSRGYAARGEPTLWRIYEDRLYLFFSVANRVAWEFTPDSAIADADKNWPELIKRLAR
ncbi:MAG: hypothetical protein KDJ16_14470 [Hyphomicrobiales bacterium]|nr:hypothetical protein [Hyphomicrobiales bacterium]